MEFTLLQDRSQRKHIFLGIIVATALFILLSMSIFGVIGLMGWIAFFISLLVTPFLINRYKFFIYMWFFGYPIGMVAYHYLGFNLDGKNPIIFLLLALSGPFAVILFYRDVFKVLKDIPAFKYLVIFFFLLIINLLRPGINNLVLLNSLKFIGFGIFVTMCSFQFFKANDWKKVINIYAVWILANCIAAIFQRVTGIGSMFLDGYQRTPGLLLHPNGLSACAVIYLALFSYLIQTVKGQKQKYFYIGVALLSIVGLLLALSKTALLGFGLVCVLMFADLSKQNKIKVVFSVVFSVLAFALLDVVFNFGIIQNAFFRIFYDQTSLTWRLKMWSDALSLFNFKTVIIGAGPYAFGRELVLMGNGIANVHNGAIELLSNYGVLGLSYLTFYTSMATFAVQKLRNETNIEVKVLSKLLFLLSSFMVIKICLDQSLWVEIFAYPILFFITVIYLEINKIKTVIPTKSTKNG